MVENKAWVSKYSKSSIDTDEVIKELSGKEIRQPTEFKMKIYRNLWNKIITFENFNIAYKNAIKGKNIIKKLKLLKEKVLNVIFANYLKK